MKLLPDNSNLKEVLEASRLFALRQGGSLADMRDANLCYANLCYANLYGANLRDANLCYANLRDADLYGANLCGANLRDANLYGAKLNFRSHALLGEALRQEAGEDIAKRQIAGLVVTSTDLCWHDFLKLRLKERTWALTTLASYIQPHDGHPAILDKYK